MARKLWLPHAVVCLLLGLVSAPTGCAELAEDEPLAEQVDELGRATVVPVGQLEAIGVVLGGNFCTGTLIGDSMVLTAAHCFCNDVDVTSCASSGTFEFKAVRPIDNPSTPSDESAVRTNVRLSGKPVIHPDFGIGAHLSNDVAVLRLDQPASTRVMVQPIPLEFTLPAANSTVTLVGFGGTLNAAGQCDGSFGTKRRGTTRITAIDIGKAPGDITLKLSTAASFATICNGDSGGPTLNANGRVVGTTTSVGGQKAVFAYLEWIALQNQSPGNRVAAWDLSGTAPVTESDYADTSPDPLGLLGWTDPEDSELAGDFLARGQDQILYINRGGTGGKLRIADYADGKSLTESPVWESWGQSTLLDGWIDPGDSQLVGDFLGRGHDQLLFVNRGAGTHRIMIVDFVTGNPVVGYLGTTTTEPFLNGWHDSNDAAVAGDFRGLGHDQLMLMNRGSGNDRILILDFQSAAPPASWVYLETYSDGVLLNGWHDQEDLMLAGDFRGLGRDQVLFINRGPGNGRVLITDFGDGAFPADWMYYEAYGQSAILDGFHDPTDVVLAGDFRKLGYDQVAFVNRNAPWFGRVLVTDFHDGTFPQEIRFSQNQAMTSPLLQRIDPNDIILAADVRGRGHAQLFTIELLEQ